MIGQHFTSRKYSGSPRRPIMTSKDVVWLTRLRRGRTTKHSSPPLDCLVRRGRHAELASLRAMHGGIILAGSLEGRPLSDLPGGSSALFPSAPIVAAPFPQSFHKKPTAFFLHYLSLLMPFLLGRWVYRRSRCSSTVPRTPTCSRPGACWASYVYSRSTWRWGNE